MISKKNKALAAGILAAAMSASAVMPAMASAAPTAEAAKSNGSYKEMFSSLYDDVITNGVQNGYLSSQTNGSGFGIPYHSVETFIVEAPDYGHETTSEAMSYIVWMAAMHDVLEGSGTASDIKKAWNTMEAMIPGWSKASGRTDIKYDTIWKQSRLKADTAEECDLPSEYPSKQPGVDAINPMFDAFKSAYGSDNGYYLMNWLADVDDWYGFGGSGKFTFINTFQRGEQESCFETVPAPCLEELKYGMDSPSESAGNGIKAIFNGIGKVPKQYSFTNAPDAEDRCIHAIYFANQNGVDCGEISGLAGKMGDQCRNDMFDKYYKAIAKDTKLTSESAGMDSKHYLMAWYTAWGGALGNYDWAWQIGCSHSHQFYQNPLAAYALLYDEGINSGMKAKDADTDYKESLKRQIEMYQWLQSKDGPFAGGCTNSWRGRYETYPSGHATFYDMAYVPHPVYADPGSNHWIGNQVWSTQRLCELYYYVTKNGDKSGQKYGGLALDEALDKLLERWINWFEENTHFDYVDADGNKYSYCIPSTLDWGSSDTDYTCTPDTWTGTYSESANQKLTCKIGGYGQGDVGCVSSLCNTLIYYAKAKGVDPKYASEEGTSVAEKGLYLANRLLSAQYNQGRDDIGLTFTDCNPSLKRVFHEEVYIPSGYSGTMPDGSKLESNATFSSIRKNYEKDEMWQKAQKYDKGEGEDNNGDGTVDIKDFQFQYHRFWHAGDAIVAYGTMALLYPEVKPLPDPDDVTTTTTTTTSTTTTTTTSVTTTTTDKKPDDVKATLWGDANCDKDVDMSDVVLIMQNLANPNKYGLNGSDDKHITEQGLANADVAEHGDGVTAGDALRIQEYLLKKVASLDPTK
ncbi:glycoside hydrolase family 48 protein [uncultured Ruminococcus sp.]|uniref:glycoside hydrolase family 48 protein n=1 Tax=uncultured Ruminococcus sp. TaxID=165186 RepID=UPI0025F4B80B|nr:glycoside hydrolase family 48 protein [uncultured Ruminococcus sp.]